MLKRKLLMTVLPLLTAGVIVGTGFSAWEFSGVSLIDKTTAGVYITGEKYDQTTLTLNYESLVLVLDQGGVDNATDETKGIYFAESGDTYSTPVTRLVATVGGSNTTDKTYSKVTFKIEIAEAYRSYLEIPSSVATRKNAYTVSVDVDLTGTDEKTATLDLGDNTIENNYITYAEGQKPEDHYTYTSWKSTVEKLGNAVTITATLS